MARVFAGLVFTGARGGWRRTRGFDGGGTAAIWMMHYVIVCDRTPTITPDCRCWLPPALSFSISHLRVRSARSAVRSIPVKYDCMTRRRPVTSSLLEGRDASHARLHWNDENGSTSKLHTTTKVLKVTQSEKKRKKKKKILFHFIYFFVYIYFFLSSKDISLAAFLLSIVH